LGIGSLADFLWEVVVIGFLWLYLTYFLVYLAVFLAKGFDGFSWWMFFVFFVRYPRHVVFAHFLGGWFGRFS
jgi:hypothetical protein